MKFGKLADISSVDFRLPADPADNFARLDRYQNAAGIPAEVLIGATGWSMKEWVGRWYAPKTKSSDFLQQYGRLFNTIELNTTHYRIPSLEQVQKWSEQVPDDFRFCPKLPQRISHVNGLGLGTSIIPEVVRAMDAFGEKLGCCFIQLPPYFDASRLAVLDQFLAAWPQLLPLAVEVRHPSWFTDYKRISSWLDTLAKHQATAVITDVAGRRDVLHMGVTSTRTMIRFVGNGMVASDLERMQSWIERLQKWRLPEVYFFPHQPDNLLAPDAASWFNQQLAAADWGNSRGPQPYEAPPEDQLSLF